MKTVDDLRRDLAQAQEERESALRALAPKHVGGEWGRYEAAAARCSALERELAKALGQEYAAPLDWPHPWDTGAPMPHVLSSGHAVHLVYRLPDRDPNWDGSYIEIVSTTKAYPLAIVTFEKCIIHKFGGPNDEVISGHPLYGRSLEPYAAHVVENSSWIRELQAINSVHSQYRPERWMRYKHYLLLFHDDTFECIAEGVTATEVRSSMAEVLKQCLADMVG